MHQQQRRGDTHQEEREDQAETYGQGAFPKQFQRRRVPKEESTCTMKSHCHPARPCTPPSLVIPAAIKPPNALPSCWPAGRVNGHRDDANVPVKSVANLFPSSGRVYLPRESAKDRGQMRETDQALRK